MLSKLQKKRTGMDATVPMLDMAFQILIFFLLAGSIAAPIDGSMNLVKTEDLEQVAPPNALVMHADGSITWNGEPADILAFMAARDPESLAPVQIIPDADAPATALVALGTELRKAGAGRVVIVTEKGLPE